LKIANITPEGVTVISNDEFNHYSNSWFLSHDNFSSF
jgi:hypothetical protein